MPNDDDGAAAKAQRRIVAVGALSLLASFAWGVPYTLVVLRDHAAEWSAAEQSFLKTDAVGKVLTSLAQRLPGTERAWRMAHLEGLTNGFFALLVAAVVPAIRDGLSPHETNELVWDIAITAFGNNVASVLAAWYGVRGFTFAGSLPNRLAAMLFGAGVIAAPRAAWLVLRGASSQ